MTTTPETSSELAAPHAAERSVIIVDGNSWMHRAFHAIHPGLTAPDGRPTNAVFGFITMLVKAIEDLAPDAVVVAFDMGKPAFRMEALAQYKIQRPPTDPLLKAQFKTVEGLLDALEIPVVQLQDWEGDDILGTLSAYAEVAGMHAYLATGDRDAFQLVSDHVSVVTSKKGVSDLVIVTPPEVVERYGITAAQVPDYLGLKGDTSDNIPGVPGVGEKTAAKLLQEYGTLEAIVEAAKAGAISGRAGANIAEHEDSAWASRTVATIVRDVPIELDLTTVSFGNFDPQRVIDAFNELRLRAPLAKVLKLRGGAVDDAGAMWAPTPAAVNADTVATTGAVGGSAGVTSGDPDGGPAPAPFRLTPGATCHYVGIAASEIGDTLFDAQLVVASSCGTNDTTATHDDAAALEQLAQLIGGRDIAALDLKASLQYVYPPDSSEPALIDIGDLRPAHTFDLGIAAYLLESRRTDFTIETLAQDYLAWGALEGEGVVAGLDESDGPVGSDASDREAALRREARLTSQLAETLDHALSADGDTERVFREIDMPLIPVIARMERAGIALDSTFLDGLAVDGRTQIDQLRREIFELAGQEFVIDSPKQLSEILFVKLGLPTGKKTKTGFSTDASVLADLAPRHPIADKLLSYRELTKLQSTYIEALPRLVGGDGRIHTSFNMTVAATGRLSSSNPNLQNIPVRTELGRRIRRAFVPGETGWKILSADYSQIELRVLAHLSEDEGLIEAFTSGEDFHTATAARVFGVTPEQIDPGMRSRAKAVNFGIVYGQGARALGLSLDIPFAEAQAIIDRYYATFPGVKEYLQSAIDTAKEQGWVATAFGRKRHIPELKSPMPQMRAFGERTAMNHPMQGTAADLIKIAMIRVDRRLREEQFEARMLLQVHDELVFEVPPHEADRLATMVREEMSGVAEFRVPLDVSVSAGETWADAK